MACKSEPKLIDITRPLELNDGTPVELVSYQGEGTFNTELGPIQVEIPVGHLLSLPNRAMTRNFRADGTRSPMVNYPNIRLRNRKETNMIDFDKPLQTRSGCTVRILARDLRGVAPIVAAIEEDGADRIVQYRLDGSPYPFDSADNTLVNVPVVVKGRRAVRLENGRFTTAFAGTSNKHIVGQVEFTVTDGKLTEARVI